MWCVRLIDTATSGSSSSKWSTLIKSGRERGYDSNGQCQWQHSSRGQSSSSSSSSSLPLMSVCSFHYFPFAFTTLSTALFPSLCTTFLWALGTSSTSSSLSFFRDNVSRLGCCCCCSCSILGTKSQATVAISPPSSSAPLSWTLLSVCCVLLCVRVWCPIRGAMASETAAAAAAAAIGLMGRAMSFPFLFPSFFPLSGLQ